MMKWLKITGIVLGALLLLAVLAWAWDLWRWKRESQLTLAESERKIEAAQARVKAVQDDLNSANRMVAELKDRKPGERVVVKNIPADCVECFCNHRISVEVHSDKGWWSYKNEDVLGPNPGELNLTPKFWDDTVGPYKIVAEDCQKELKKCQGTSKPKLFTLDYRTTVLVGIRTDGYVGGIRFEPGRIGISHFAVGPWLDAGSVVAQDGSLKVWGAAGLEVQFAK
jgi:hypothetical protein